MRAVPGVLTEKLAGAAFAHQATKDVGERDDDGVNLAGFDSGQQLVQVHRA